MAAWTTQRAGNFSVPSDNVASPWHDAGAQTALAAIPDPGDTIDNTGGYALVYDLRLMGASDAADQGVVLRHTVLLKRRYGPGT